MKRKEGRPRIADKEKRILSMTLYFNYMELKRVHKMLKKKGSKPKQLRDKVLEWVDND